MEAQSDGGYFRLNSNLVNDMCSSLRNSSHSLSMRKPRYILATPIKETIELFDFAPPKTLGKLEESCPKNTSMGGL